MPVENIDLGTVVSVPEGEKVYLVTQRDTAFGKKTEIIPFEEIPIEERILKTVKMLGEDVKEIAKSIVEAKKKKAEEVV
jgi:hypothetical protein